MLCRVADSLFWMSRYIERAENTVRLVDVTLQALLESEHSNEELSFSHWRPILSSLGDLTLYESLKSSYSSESVTDFLIVDKENPSSVYSCVGAARENARMIRDQISSEMWEIINRLYLFLKKANQSEIRRDDLADFFQKLREYSQLYQGVTDSTFPHRQGYDFITMGKFIERADKTGRILDSKYYMETTTSEDDGAMSIAQWTALLRGCSALEAYYRVYVCDVIPDNVADFLLLSRDFPRSVLFCLNRLQLAMHAISNCPVTHFTNEAERLCGLLISRLNYATIDDIVGSGLHEFLEQLRNDIEKIALALNRTYMFSEIVDPVAELRQES